LKKDFIEGIWVFLFLMIGRLIDMYFGLNGAIFVTSKKFKYDLIFTCLLVVTVLVINFWLIPIYGITGAAIASSIGLIVYNFCRVVFVFFAYKLHPFHLNQFKVIGLGMITLLVGIYTDKLFLNQWIQAFYQFFVFLILFILPIFRFNLEPDIILYTKKSIGTLKKKLGLR
jgi:O-antigen/teichoic acid export membrane protein